MDHNGNKRSRITIGIISLIVVAVIGLIVFAFISSSKPSVNPYGEDVNIANLNKYTAGQPTDEDAVNVTKHGLYLMITRNTDISDDNLPEDIYVRDNSFSQTYEEARDLHNVTFLVDVASIKQSYRVSYQWSPSSSNNVDEYGTIVLCPLQTELIYGPFECHDDFTEMVGSNDPIARFLPHFGDHFRIDEAKLDADPPMILATIFVYLYETDYNNRDRAANEVKPLVAEWMRSKGLDPSKYNIIYKVEVN